MKYIPILLIATVFASCKQPVTALTDKISGSDSMAINWFKGDGSMDTVVAVKIIKDKNTINQLAKLAGDAVTSKSGCGYDGSLHFFKMDKVIQDIRFRVNDAQCLHFEFVLKGKPYSTGINSEAKTLLQSLR